MSYRVHHVEASPTSILGHTLYETVRDYVVVEAPSARAAVVAAARHPDFPYARLQRDDYLCPFTGVRAYPECENCQGGEVLGGDESVDDTGLVTYPKCGGSCYVGLP